MKAKFVATIVMGLSIGLSKAWGCPDYPGVNKDKSCSCRKSMFYGKSITCPQNSVCLISGDDRYCTPLITPGKSCGDPHGCYCTVDEKLEKVNSEPKCHKGETCVKNSATGKGACLPLCAGAENQAESQACACQTDDPSKQLTQCRPGDFCRISGGFAMCISAIEHNEICIHGNACVCAATRVTSVVNLKAQTICMPSERCVNDGGNILCRPRLDPYHSCFAEGGCYCLNSIVSEDAEELVQLGDICNKKVGMKDGGYDKRSKIPLMEAGSSVCNHNGCICLERQLKRAIGDLEFTPFKSVIPRHERCTTEAPENSQTAIVGYLKTFSQHSYYICISKSPDFSPEDSNIKDVRSQICGPKTVCVNRIEGLECQEANFYSNELEFIRTLGDSANFVDRNPPTQVYARFCGGGQDAKMHKNPNVLYCTAPDPNDKDAQLLILKPGFLCVILNQNDCLCSTDGETGVFCKMGQRCVQKDSQLQCKDEYSAFECVADNAC